MFYRVPIKIYKGNPEKIFAEIIKDIKGAN
jgi:hypothetical protein